MKPFRTATRWGYLASIFSPRSDREFHSLIACVCVLFEDLRIEIAGIYADDLDQLDECDKELRRFYFLRRSIATLHEFAVTLQELDRLPSFQALKSKFSKTALSHWTRAIDYFRKYEKNIARIRHHAGGHFRKPAGAQAIDHLQSDALGCLEVADYAKGGGAKLFFAHELAATAVVENVRGKTVAAKASKLLRYAVVGYRHSAWAVDCITSTYLWPRFGK
jgi:hypothetical protein